MNGKKARKLRRIALKETRQNPSLRRKMYQDLKVMYKNKDILLHG